jgi:hypothetical protein
VQLSNAHSSRMAPGHHTVLFVNVFPRRTSEFLVKAPCPAPLMLMAPPVWPVGSQTSRSSQRQLLTRLQLRLQVNKRRTPKVFSELVVGHHHRGWSLRIEPSAIALCHLIGYECIAINQAAVSAATGHEQAPTKPIVVAIGRPCSARAPKCLERVGEKSTAAEALLRGLVAGDLAFIVSENAVGDIHSVATLELDPAVGGRCAENICSMKTRSLQQAPIRPVMQCRQVTRQHNEFHADEPVLLTKLQRFTVATVVEASRKPPVLPFVSTLFVTLTSCSRTLTPAFRKTTPSPLPLVRSKLQV